MKEMYIKLQFLNSQGTYRDEVLSHMWGSNAHSQTSFIPEKMNHSFRVPSKITLYQLAISTLMVFHVKRKTFIKFALDLSMKIIIIIIIIIIIMSLVTGLFFPVILLNQQW